MSDRSIWKAGLAGAIGGALGTVVLNLFQKGSLEGTRKLEERWADGRRYTRQQEELLKMFEDAHIATAEALGVPVTLEKYENTAMRVEFAFGILCGTIYGVLAEYQPAATVGAGSVYGAVLFTGASEVVLPAIGFVPSPAARTPVQHVGGLAGNVVYGITTEVVRRLLRPS